MSQDPDAPGFPPDYLDCHKERPDLDDPV